MIFYAIYGLQSFCDRDCINLMLSENFKKWPYFEQADIDAVSEVLRSGKINRWTGDKNLEFEKALASSAGTKFAIALSNGTTALELALVGIGLKEGDEVITTCRTFMASASCVAVRGGVPIVADVDENSQNITAETIEPLITPKTRAIIVVHHAGFPCDMDSIMELARSRGIYVIEDCAQAHGAKYKGKPVGGIGNIGAWSFCQDKIITCGGEGGAVTVNDETMYRRMWSYKDHGRDYDLDYNTVHPEGFRWYLRTFGTNMRMTEMQAVLGIRGLKNLPDWTAKRTANAKAIDEALKDLQCVRLTQIPEWATHAHYKHYFFLRPEFLKPDWNASRIISEVNKAGVPLFSGTCWNISQEECFKSAGLAKDETQLPVAASLRDTSFMTLVHPTITQEEAFEAGKIIASVLRSACK